MLIINHRLHYLWQSGIINYWTTKYTPNVDKCLVHQRNKHEKEFVSGQSHKALSLKDFGSAFLFVGLGLSVALLVFLIELSVFFYKQIHGQKKREMAMTKEMFNHFW